MRLEDLQEELKKDVFIDSTKLQYEAANNVMLYSKWLNKHSSIKRKCLELKHRKKLLLKLN